MRSGSIAQRTETRRTLINIADYYTEQDPCMTQILITLDTSTASIIRIGWTKATVTLVSLPLRHRISCRATRSSVD